MFSTVIFKRWALGCVNPLVNFTQPLSDLFDHHCHRAKRNDLPMIRAQASIATPERKSEMTEDHLLHAKKLIIHHTLDMISTVQYSA